MLHNSKYSIVLLGLCAALSLRAEVISLSRAGDWRTATPFRPYAKNVLRVTGRVGASSVRAFEYDPRRSYTIRGVFRQLPGSDSNVFRIGLQFLDEKKKPIEFIFAHPVPKTDTVLKAAVKPGDRSIVVENAAAWKTRVVTAYKTSPDKKDLPNRNIIRQMPVSIRKTAKGWQVTFAKAVGISLPAGTAVRQHFTGPHVRYLKSGTAGDALGDLKCTGWYPGTKYFRIAIISGANRMEPGDKTPVLEIRNARLEVK